MNPKWSLLFWFWPCFCRQAGVWRKQEARRLRPARQSENFALLVWVSNPTDELKLAGESLGLPVRWDAAQAAGLALAALVPVGETSFSPSAGIRGTDGDEGYNTAPAPSGELVLAAKSQHGLANGLYDARWALLVKGAVLKMKPPPRNCPRRANTSPASPGAKLTSFSRPGTYRG